MHPFLKQVHGLHSSSLSSYSRLLDFCSSTKSLDFVNIIHARLIKVGFNRHTFLGNRCLDLYCKFGSVDDALKVFNYIVNKNCVSWNIYLKGLFRFSQRERACQLFDEMPVRDVVSWNSMISAHVSYGFIDYAMELFLKMQNTGVRPSEYTYSILMSIASSPSNGKQIHGSMIRSGMELSNVVLGNSLVDMYGKLSLADYACGVFLTMEKLDTISWNSLIWACHRAGCGELALYMFCLMRTTQHKPDQYTISTVISICCNMRDLEKGKQIFGFCLKVGLFSNSIVLSAAIDLFSKCNRLEDAVQLFKEADQWDSALCNSMISSYAGHGFAEHVMLLFVLMMRENLRPTEFTISCVLSSVSDFIPADQGSQIHSLIVKMGMESDPIVASPLMEMYSKVGLIDYAVKIFANLSEKDLISWNIIIMGLALNGRAFETLEIFEEITRKGLVPDNITVAGVLSACNHGNFIDEGMRIFSSMRKKYGIIPGVEHYASIVELLSRAGKLKKAMGVIAEMHCEPSYMIWASILHSSATHGDLELAERAAERMMELEPKSSIPYLVLARAYEMRGRWESMVRIRKAIKHKCLNSMIGKSMIGIKNHVYTFKEDELLHHGGKDIYLVLGLLIWQTKVEGYL